MHGANMKIPLNLFMNYIFPKCRLLIFEIYHIFNCNQVSLNGHFILNSDDNNRKYALVVAFCVERTSLNNLKIIITRYKNLTFWVLSKATSQPVYNVNKQHKTGGGCEETF